MGFEYEQARPLAAALGFYLMIFAQPAWYWFTPLITPAILLFPGKLKEWENQEEQQKLQKKLLEIDRTPSVFWRIIKLVFWLGLLALIWYIGSYYLLVWLFG